MCRPCTDHVPARARCQLASHFRFEAFKEGKQMIGRNPKISCIGNKLLLRKTQVEYEEKCKVAGIAHLATSSFLPMTYVTP